MTRFGIFALIVGSAIAAPFEFPSFDPPAGHGFFPQPAFIPTGTAPSFPTGTAPVVPTGTAPVPFGMWKRQAWPTGAPVSTGTFPVPTGAVPDLGEGRGSNAGEKAAVAAQQFGGARKGNWKPQWGPTNPFIPGQEPEAPAPTGTAPVPGPTGA